MVELGTSPCCRSKLNNFRRREKDQWNLVDFGADCHTLPSGFVAV